jgi:alkylhydroperoxidase family enzyme
MFDDVIFNGRIGPIPQTQWTDFQKEVMGDLIGADGSAPNVIATIVRHPELCRAWKAFLRTLLWQGLLSDRDREIIILRIAWRLNSVYEWRQHAGRIDGLTLEGLSNLSGARTWSDSERVLIRSIDEFCDSESIGEPNWSSLASHYDDQQLLEVVFLCTTYRALASVLHILGVEPDSDEPTLPPSPAKGETAD